MRHDEPKQRSEAASVARTAENGRGETGGRSRRPRASLLSKMIVVVSVAIVIAELALLLPLVNHYRRALYDAEKQVLEQSATMIIDLWSTCPEVVHRHDKERADGRPSEPEAESNQASAAALLADFEERVRAHAPKLGRLEAVVLDADGRALGVEAPKIEALFTEAGSVTRTSAPSPAARTEKVSDRLVRIEPILDPLEGAVIGYLALATPLMPLRAAVIQHVLLALGLMLVVVLIVGVAAILVSNRILLRPFRAFARANRALMRGDEQAALIPESEIPNDELGDLMLSRNRIYRLMLRYQRSVQEQNETLARQGLELERWARELERRVEEKQRELHAAHDQLLAAEKLAATGRLAAGLAHELNNPLASIAGYAEDLLQLSADPMLLALEAFAEFPDSLRTIEEQAFRCKRILNQLLSFARPASFEVRPLSLAPVVQGVLPLVEHRVRGRDIALLLDLDPELGPALVDRANLEHVLVNLIENAIDAIEGPSGRVTIATRAHESGMQLIEVRDTGKGISEHEKRRIFDPFFTTKAVGEGTGLGLSICHAIVTRMGGAIEVESEPGKGACFRILLPAAKDGEQQGDPSLVVAA